VFELVGYQGRWVHKKMVVCKGRVGVGIFLPLPGVILPAPVRVTDDSAASAMFFWISH